MSRFSDYISQQSSDLWHVFVTELKRIVRDPGVVLIFFIAGLGYPIVYNLVYWNDTLTDVPVAVVDMDNSPESRRFLHDWEATPDVKISYICYSMQEAELLMKQQKIHGILYIPSDYSRALQTAGAQAHISIYADMSSFLYMKAVYMSANMVMLDEMHNVQIDRYERMGMDDQTAWTLVQGIPYEPVTLFNPDGGYSTFLIPAMLIMILHQTLFFGIGMLAGTAREENETLYFLPNRKRRRSVFRIIGGRALAYFVVYLGITAIDLLLVPRLFHLPHVGNPLTIMSFAIPFLLATIFFSMTVSLTVRNRETGMVTLLATTLIMFFITGVSWPQELLPKFWLYLSYLIPATWGIHGFLHINTMGANLTIAALQYHALWGLAAIYGLLATGGLWLQGYLYEQRQAAKQAAKQAAELPDTSLQNTDHIVTT